MLTFVDLQFVRVGEEYFIKELAAINDDIQILHCLFKPLFDYSLLPLKNKKQLFWLKKYHHQIDWEDGFIPYNQGKHIIDQELKKFKNIFVKGLEKKKWLEKHGIHVKNIEDLGCDIKIINLYKEPSCRQHQGVCAVRNVFYLQEWFKNYDNNKNFVY